MARPGEYLIVRYDVEGPEVWHERLCTAVSPTTPGLLAVVTPDDDHYVEECTLNNEDLADMRWIGKSGETPAGIPGNRIYRFVNVPGAVQLRQLLRDGAMMVGAQMPAQATAAPRVIAGAAAARVPRAVLPVGAAGAARPQPQPNAGTVWAYAEDAGGHRRGDGVGNEDGERTTIGDRGLLEIASGVVFIRHMLPADVDEYLNDDLRVLPVSFDRQGQRRRPFPDAVDLLMADEPEVGLGLQGPRTTMWLPNTMRDASQTPTSRREQWQRATRVSKGDRPVYEHEVLSRALEAMVVVDQLNPPALQPAELICRRIQLIEEAHRLSPGAPDYTAGDHFMGWQIRRHGAVVAPALSQHVSDHLRTEAAMSKESRKAKEEAKLRRGGGGNGGGGGSHGAKGAKNGQASGDPA